MKIGAFVVAVGLALPATGSLAEPTTLAGDELRQAITGKTVFLNISGFELPIRYPTICRGPGHRSRELLAGRRCPGPRQMVGRWRSTLPAMVELDGGKILLLPADARRLDGALGTQ